MSLPAFNWDFLLATASWLAARTETKVDDLLVELLKAAKEDPLVGPWFQSRIVAGASTELSTDGTLSFVSEEPPQEIVEALFDRGVFKAAGAKDVGEVRAKLKEWLPYAIELAKLLSAFAK